MNEKIAIQIIKNNYPDNSTVFGEALDLAIKALEKQIPKKPIMENGILLDALRVMKH